MTDPGAANVEGVDLDGMTAYLADAGVRFAVLFGSQARGTADESSDVDVALSFPEELDRKERFRLRNRIDAALQEYADGFVDVSDVDVLPTPVAHGALEDGTVLVGDDEAVEAKRRAVGRAYEATADERERERQAFIDRLARGDV